MDRSLLIGIHDRENFHREHLLFHPFGRTRPPVILMVMSVHFSDGATIIFDIPKNEIFHNFSCIFIVKLQGENLGLRFCQVNDSITNF